MLSSFNLNVVEAKRFIDVKKTPKNLHINHNLSIRGVNKSDTGFEVDFAFTVNYTTVGFISIEGTVYVESREEFEEHWTAHGKLPDKDMEQLNLMILNNCIIEALILSREIKLPPPIPPPVHANASSKKDKKKKGWEVEVA